MKKSSMIFKLLCLTIAFALCLSVITVFADEVTEAEDDADKVQEALETESGEDATNAEEADEDVEEETGIFEEIKEEAEEESKEEAEEEIEEEHLDLFEATLRDGGVYVTPGELNDAAFNYDGLRYKVSAGQGNSIKLDGFESNPTIETTPIPSTAKDRLYATGEITTSAAHSGYFGLSLSSGGLTYRTGVSENCVYVFSAWVKMPQRATIKDDDRAFKLVAESGNVYVVGYNEIGREVTATGSWQQILFTFKAPENGLFQISFSYRNSQPLAIDDIELYEAEVFTNPLEIKNVVCTDAEGNAYTYSSGFSKPGTLTHTATLYNSDEDDVFFIAVMALFKNDILIDLQTINDCALILDETDVTFEIVIPEDDDISQYKYMVYFINDANPTQFYGKVPSKTNPYIVKGK